MVAWDRVSRAHVLRAIEEYDRLGPEQFFSEHGFAPTTTYELAREKRRYPPKAILGTAYEFATGQRLGSSDFEGRKTGAVRVLQQPRFTAQEKQHRPGKAAFRERERERERGGFDGAHQISHGRCRRFQALLSRSGTSRCAQAAASAWL